MRSVIVSVLLAFAAAAGGTAPAWSQSPIPGVGDPQRNCQTVRTCRFDRGGSYRGCLSSYTCRVCRTVKIKCDIGGQTQNCHTVRCSWGG